MSDVATLTRLVAELSGRLDALAARVPVRIGTPQVPSPNLVVEVIQSAHGFTIGQVVTNTGVSWELAAAGDDSIGVICKVVDADTVWVCEWGIVCIDSATFAEGSVYYLGATAGTPTTTPGTPKRAVFFAVSPTMILVTNPAKDASGGGLDPITGPAVLGKADAGSGDPAAIAAAADNTVLGRRAGALTFAKVALAELDDLTGPAVIGKVASGAGAAAAITGTTDTVLVCTASGLAFAQVATAMIADLAITAAKIAAGAVGPDELADTTVTPNAYGSATQVATFTVDQQGRITAAANVTCTPAWASVTGKPTYFDTQINGANNNTDTTDTGAFIVSGTPNNTTLTLYEKRPRFNAKWLRGTAMGATAPSTKYQIIKYDPTASNWNTWDMAGGTPRTGDILYVDTAAAAGYALVQAGKALSVLGRSAATDGLPAPIEAAEGTVLQRAVGGTLSFATTIVLGKAGTGGSLGGWKVNASTSATAAEWEASGSTNSLTAKYSGTTVLEVKAGSTQQIVLKNTSGTAGTTIQIDWSGNSPRLQMFRPDISTTVPMLDINLATTPTGGWTTAKAVTLREIDVCDSGTAKKVMRMESAPY